MLRIIGTGKMSQEEWTNLRSNYICGTDAAVILGKNPYKSVLQLYEEKRNKVIENAETTYTHFGKVMEPIIKREFTARTGLRVRSVNYLLGHPEFDWMAGNIDGVVREEDGSLSLFEAKTSSEWRRQEWEGKIPDEYYAQVQHYLALDVNFKRAYVVCILGGNTYICHVIERDNDYIEALIEAEKQFVECVKNGIPPKADSSKATSQYLNALYSDTVDDEIDLPEDAQELAKTYLSLEGQIKSLSEQKETITNRLKDLVKDHERGRAGNHIISWKLITKKSLNSSKVKSILGESYDDCLTESTYRRFSVA